MSRHRSYVRLLDRLCTFDTEILRLLTGQPIASDVEFVRELGESHPLAVLPDHVRSYLLVELEASRPLRDDEYDAAATRALGVLLEERRCQVRLNVARAELELLGAVPPKPKPASTARQTGLFLVRIHKVGLSAVYSEGRPTSAVVVVKYNELDNEGDRFDPFYLWSEEFEFALWGDNPWDNAAVGARWEELAMAAGLLDHSRIHLGPDPRESLRKLSNCTRPFRIRVEREGASSNVSIRKISPG